MGRDRDESVVKLKHRKKKRLWGGSKKGEQKEGTSRTVKDLVTFKGTIDAGSVLKSFKLQQQSKDTHHLSKRTKLQVQN